MDSMFFTAANAAAARADFRCALSLGADVVGVVAAEREGDGAR